MLTINIDPGSTIPMYDQIYSFIKNEIKTGVLPFHYKLPSTRNLSLNLSVSRNTIDMAYAQLVSEGYIESVPKSGYFVSMVSDLTHISAPPVSFPKPVVKESTPYLYDFSPFAIDINSFPYNIWRKLSKHCMSEYNNDLFLLGNNQGDESLRKAIAGYLHGSRGVNCSGDQIIIGAGADYLLQLLAQLLSYIKPTQSSDINLDNVNPLVQNTCLYSPKINIGMENPTYKKAYHIFTGMGYNVIPMNLDESGIQISQLIHSKTNIAYVTPSHQYPLGIVMPIKRRLELLQWADNAPDRYIIEDDHDSEFRYKGKPIPALQGIDSQGKVIYLGTFSRAVAPAIRIGYMVLPKNLLELYKKHLYYYSSTVSRVDQYIITHFITDGYFERHLNKIRKLYKSKHDLLIQSLKVFEDKLIIEGENAGLHLVLHFQINLLEQEIIATAAKKGIRLYGLSEHYITKDESNTSSSILLGYANLTEANIIKGISSLYDVLKEYL